MISAPAYFPQKIAIVGPTGAGKTTIVKLLMRFYDVNEGNTCGRVRYSRLFASRAAFTFRYGAAGHMAL